MRRKQLDEAKPLADKVGEVKPVKELAPKVADKPEVKTDSKPAAEAKPAPKPEPKAAEAKPEPKAAEKIEKPKDAKPKADQIAEALKKDEAKKPPKPEKKPPEFKPDQIAEELKKDETKKPRPSPKFDADQVAALLDKREPQRQVATAETLNGAVSLGAPNAPRRPIVAERARRVARAPEPVLESPPAGVDANVQSLRRAARSVQARRFAGAASRPWSKTRRLVLGPALAESAKRALLLCQPFTMLKPEHYDQWKDIEVKFNPHELLGG